MTQSFMESMQPARPDGHEQPPIQRAILRVVDGARLREPQGGGAKGGPGSKTELRSSLEWLRVADPRSGHSLVPDNSKMRPIQIAGRLPFASDLRQLHIGANMVLDSGFVLRLSALFTALSASAQPIWIPNASFESPATVFVDNRVDAWQKTPKPVWYDESGGFSWDQLSGVFRNSDPGKPDHIPNTDGNQGIYLFAVPQVGIVQDSLGSGATFQVGKAYLLTAGVVGGAGGMTNGASLSMGLHFRDAAGTRVDVGTTQIVFDPARFPDVTNYVDVQLRVPPVKAGDAWAGKAIGIQLLSTVAPNLVGGYWDIDHVRLHEVLEIPNGSFESPSTAFVDNRVEVWQKTPKPVWYDESGGFAWDQLSGVFKNTEPGKEDHIVNMDGPQAFYLFAVPTVGLFLDDRSTNRVGSAGETVWNARFEPGNAYALRLAVQGGGGGMTNGVTLGLSLYYRDDAGNPVPVAHTTVTNDTVAFPSRNHFSAVSVQSSAVRATDPWAGKPIGIQILSTVDPTRAGGYWNVDQVRLAAIPEPGLQAPRIAAGSFEAVVRSEPGARLTVVASDTIAGPASNWAPVVTVTNTSGFTPIRETLTGTQQRFFQVRPSP